MSKNYRLLAEFLLELADVLELEGLTQGEPDEDVQIYVNDKGQGIVVSYGGQVWKLSVREVKSRSDLGEMMGTDGDEKDVKRQLMQLLRRK